MACGISVFYFRLRAINESIKGAGSPGSQNIFRKGSLLLQLTISFVMMFCSSIFFKQINYLQQTDLGINRRNVAGIQTTGFPLPPHLVNQLLQVPGIVDALPVSSDFLKNMSSSTVTAIIEEDNTSYTITMVTADAHFFDFFGIEIIEGMGYVNEYNYNKVLNETAVKELGDVLSFDNVIGVARDFYITPTTKAIPTQIYYPDPEYNTFRELAYRYENGMREQVEHNITRWLRNEFPERGEFAINFTYMDDIFDEYFISERALLRLLSVTSLACIIIAIFGVYSLTSLTCQQRRKEIAIRKTYGAEVLDIINIFFKEYLIMLAMAALVAFPAGYIIMKRWLESYVKQTSMDAWIYMALFLTVFVVIVFSIFSIVLNAAKQNPAEVVKSE